MTVTGLRRRIAPSVALKLDLKDDSGENFTRNLRLSFDCNAMAMVQEETGWSMMSGQIWDHLDEKTLSIMLHAAVLALQPEYGVENGLEVLRSYMDFSNAEQIAEALNEAFLIQLPAEKADEIRKKQKAAREKGENPTQPATDPAPVTKAAEV